MAVKDIIQIPNDILQKPCKEALLDEDTKQLVTDLLDTLNSHTHPEGAGIAAPQIGVSKRVCIVKKFFPDPSNPHIDRAIDFVLINPVIIFESAITDTFWEGCLSIPNKYGRVKRAQKIKVQAQDLNGQEFIMKADDYFARVILHEVDHLDGILFTDKVVGELITERQLDKLLEA